MDEAALNKALNKVQMEVFIGNNDALLAPIMARLQFKWSTLIPTAGINHTEIVWNPDWFWSLPDKTKKTVLVHELWHIARLHSLRRGNRKVREWNWACDVETNNMLHSLGYSFEGTTPWMMPELGDMVAEDIYDYLFANNLQCPSGNSWSLVVGSGDIEDETKNPSKEQEILEIVSYAHSSAKIAGKQVDGIISELLDKFLAPKISWNQSLHSLLRMYKSKAKTWSVRNRRYKSIMPARKGKRLKLDEITFFLDVSGSISSTQATRFITEVRKVKQEYKPNKIVIVQFDTDIQVIDVFSDKDPLDKLQIIGRGGTDLQCVSDYIEEHKPTLAVVFSDMYCEPMLEPTDTKMVFVVQDNPSFVSFGFGSVIHVQD